MSSRDSTEPNLEGGEAHKWWPLLLLLLLLARACLVLLHTKSADVVACSMELLQVRQAALQHGNLNAQQDKQAARACWHECEAMRATVLLSIRATALQDSMKQACKKGCKQGCQCLSLSLWQCCSCPTCCHVMLHWLITRHCRPGSCCRPASGRLLGSWSLLSDRLSSCKWGSSSQMLVTVPQLLMRLSVRSSCCKLGTLAASCPAGPCSHKDTGSEVVHRLCRVSKQATC